MRVRPARSSYSRGPGTSRAWQSWPCTSVTVDPNHATVMRPDALDANRSGQLTNEQRQGLGRYDRGRRRGILGLVPVFAVIGILALSAKGPAPSASARPYVGVGALAAAVIALLVAAGARDKLADDLRTGRVAAIEGAIEKRHLSSASVRTDTGSYYLDVAGKSFLVPRGTYDAAPDAGIVRVYYLPRSRKVVNYERLPDRPLPPGALESPMAVLAHLSRALRSHGSVESAEAKATVAAIVSAMAVEHTRQATPPPMSERDPRPLAEAIVGRWQSGPITLELSFDGAAKLVMPGGAERHGHWSVDASGKLHADATGKEQVGDAWVVGDTLTICTDGHGLTFRRA